MDDKIKMFIEAVHEMRDAQKDYFESEAPSPELYQIKHDSEALVDQYLLDFDKMGARQ